ncbi:MAG: peptidase M48 [Saprospiraceae bacterium]|nr:MAG: peptidase M48 [Saprospiraceae bacterium]
MLLSESQEIAMGQESDPSIQAQFGVYESEAMQAFINEKGQMMAKTSHRPELKYEFKILDSPVVNAFALPGGFVYFTRGIMAHFNNEAEFAGVLGHEIGHITARHSARQYSKQILAQVGLVAGMVLSEDFRQFGDLANQGVGLLFLKFGRDNESESDRLGVEYSTKIGYDAHEMAGFFNTLSRLSGGPEGRIPTFLSTHPDPADRNVKVDALADKWQEKVKSTQFKVNRNSYLRMIDGLVYGEDPRQGYLENDNFYHPELKFQFPVPANWLFENSPIQVQMAPKDGKALMLLTLAQEKTLDAAAQATLEQFQLQMVDSRKLNVNGLSALEMTADQVQQQDAQTQQQQQEPVRTLTYLIEYNGMIYKIMGLSLRPDFNTYRSTFLNTMTRFNTLNDPSKLNRQPERIKIETVTKSGTFQQALQAAKMPTNRHEELAILNGMELNGPITKGTLIKVIRD